MRLMVALQFLNRRKCQLNGVKVKQVSVPSDSTNNWPSFAPQTLIGQLNILCARLPRPTKRHCVLGDREGLAC